MSENRSELKRSYDLLIEAGQIAFVTFHQNYSYEDFVEGLRPTTGTEESDDRSGFGVTPRRGIFREISALAEQARKTAGHTGGFEIGDRQVLKMSLGRAGVEDHTSMRRSPTTISAWAGAETLIGRIPAMTATQATMPSAINGVRLTRKRRAAAATSPNSGPSAA